MSTAYRVFFLIAVFAGIMAMQYNLDADRTATRQVKNTLELAVHDAALALDETQMVKGLLVFDQVVAEQKLRDSLAYHLKLDSTTLAPLDPSFYQHPMTIKYLEFIDDSNASFPYTYTNPEYHIVDTLNGPGIVAVVQIQSPRYFAGNGITVTQAAVYEYK